VSVDRKRHTVAFDRPGVELDLGGIGKGYAADRVAALLRRRGVASALVSLGGSSVYGLGAPPGAAGWDVSVADPTAPERGAVRVSLRDRALSISGGYERFFVKDGVTYAHIMDPRSGRPVQGVLSVAVVSASATDGDALDDVLFVQGLERARAFVALAGDVGLLLRSRGRRGLQARALPERELRPRPRKRRRGGTQRAASRSTTA